MDRPYTKWLVLKETLDGQDTDEHVLDEKNVPWPFMPLAIGYESTGRARVGLRIGGEPLQKSLGDGDAMYGTMGNLVAIPPEAQVVYPARRDFRLDAADVSGSENRICVAILGALFVGSKNIQNKPGPTVQWVNMHGTAAGNGLVVISEDIDFPFMPVAIGFTKTARCEVVLFIDNAPLMNQSADISSVFGTLGNMVVIPERTRRIYEGKTTFSCEVTDLSGSDNCVDVSILGLQYKD